MRKLIRDVIDLPVYIDNDANCAVMAEAVAGAAKGSKDSRHNNSRHRSAGVIVNGRIYSGFNQLAPGIPDIRSWYPAALSAMQEDAAVSSSMRQPQPWQE